MENSTSLLIDQSETGNQTSRINRINIDDLTLIALFKKFGEEIMEKKRRLEGIARKKDGDYLYLLLARLSYKFSKEEYDALFSEIKRRGLKIQD